MKSRFAGVGAGGIVERSLRFSSRTVPFALGSLLAVLVLGCASTEVGGPVCPSSARWVERIEAVAAPDQKITGDEWALAEEIRTGGELTVDCLVPMLKAGDTDFRAFVAFLLFEMKGLEPRHVEPILAAAKREGVGSGLPWVLARIDSPAAIDGLIELLRRHPVAASQIGYPLILAATHGPGDFYEVEGDWGYPGLGGRVIAALTRLLEANAPDELNVQLAAVEILGSMRAGVPAEPLIRLAADPDRPIELRRAAIFAIPAIWGAAFGSPDGLRELARSASSGVETEASAALFILEGPQANVSFSRALAPLARPGSGLRDAAVSPLEHSLDARLSLAVASIARLGREMRDLAPSLMGLLSPEVRPDVRLSAAWALGVLGEATAGPALTRVLDDEDWFLAATAAESIGRLGYRPAHDRLVALSESHWFPPVRRAMRRATEALAGSHAYPAIQYEPATAYFLQFEVLDPDKLPGPTPAPCERQDPLPEAPRRDGWLATGDERRRHAYVFDDPYTLRGSRSRLDVVPSFGVRADGGWLLASNRGEFGGELVFEPDGEPVRFVARGNFEDVHTLPDGRRVATEGLAHMGSDYGALYEIRQQGEDFSIRFWRRLPGAPQTSWVRVDGTLLVNTTRGSVVVHPDGRMELAACSKSAGDPSRLRQGWPGGVFHFPSILELP